MFKEVMGQAKASGAIKDGMKAALVDASCVRWVWSKTVTHNGKIAWARLRWQPLSLSAAPTTASAQS